MAKKVTAPKDIETDAPESADAESEGSSFERRGRSYKGSQTVDHDLFKLEAASMRKNVSWNKAPMWETFSHSHIFHTIDSNGVKQSTSAAVGGHFHVMEVTQNGGVPQVTCSGPMKYVRGFNEQTGLMERQLEPCKGDNHVHDVTYLGSEKITLRNINEEFAKVDAQIRAHQNPTLAGIKEGA